MSAPWKNSSYSEFRDDVMEEEDKISQLQKDPILSPLLEDLCQWLAKILDIHISPDNFTVPLQTGNNLCRLAVYISKKAVDVGKTCPPLRFKADAKPFTFQARCNIEAFVKWAKAAGVRDTCLFETVDIVELKYPRNVLICLLELSRLADVYGVEPPELIKLEKSTKIAWQDLVALTLKRAKKNGLDRVMSVADVATAVKEIQMEVAEADELGPERSSSIVNKWREFTKKSSRSRSESEKSKIEEEAESDRSKVEEVAESERNRIEEVAESDRSRIDEVAESDRSRIKEVAESDRSRIGEVAESDRTRIEEVADSERSRIGEVAEFERSRIEDVAEAVSETTQDTTTKEVVRETEEVSTPKSEVSPELEGDDEQVLLIEDDLPPEEDFSFTVQQEHMITVRSQPDWDGVRMRGTKDGSRDQVGTMETGGTVEPELGYYNNVTGSPNLEIKSHEGEKGMRQKRLKHASDEDKVEVSEETSKNNTNSPARVSSEAVQDADGGYTNPMFHIVDGSSRDQSESSSAVANGPNKPPQTAVYGRKVKWSFVFCYPAVYSDEETTSLSIEQYQDLREKRYCVLLLGILLTLIGTAIAVSIGILRADNGTNSDEGENSEILPWPVFYTLLAISLLCLIIGMLFIAPTAKHRRSGRVFRTAENMT